MNDHSPSIRSRYVTRALYLQSDRGFRRALDTFIAQWNESYPRFSTQRGDYPPDQPTRNVSRDIYPEFLLQSADDPNYDPEKIDSERFAAFHTWERAVYDLCVGWWPPRYYPNWIGGPDHPARDFVTGCLLWDPKAVPTEWIKRVWLVPVGTTHNLLGRPSLDQDPQREYEQSFEEQIMQGMEAAIKENPHFTLDRFEKIAGQAHILALQKIDKERRSRPRLTYWYLPLFPGLTSTDLRANEKNIIEVANQDGGIANHAIALRAENLSIDAIAKLLGVTRPRIQQILKESSPREE